MNRNIILTIVFATVLMISIFSGCGTSSKDSIAVINGYEVTQLEFNEYYNRIKTPLPSAEEEYNQKRELLDSVIVSRILVQAAYEKNIDKSSELARIILLNKNQFLLDILFLKDIAPNIEPSEAEMKDYYNKLEYKYRASHILLDNIDTAQMLLERIKVGENFAQLAYEYSIDATAKRNRGDLGYFAWGKVVDAFQEAILKMEPGEISTPVKSQYGYHLIKMVDKLPNDGRGSYEEMKEYLNESIKNKKTNGVTEEFMKKIRERFPITIEQPTCDYLLHKRSRMYPPQLLKSLPRNDFDIEALDRDEKELIIATLEGHQITVIEYLDELRNIPEQYRPDLDDYDSLATIIFAMKQNDILALEAVRQGYDNDPVYLEKMRLFKEMNMAEIMKNDSLPSPIAPDESTIRKYYDEHLIEFTVPAKVQVNEILLSDELKAKKLVKTLKSLRSFKAQAQDLTERPGYKTKSGNLGRFDRRRFPQIFDLAIKSPIGAIVGPVVSNQKYSIFYVVDKTVEQLKDYLGVKKDIVEKLLNQSHGDVFKSWIDDRLKNSQVEINEDAIWETIDKTQYSSVASDGN